MRFIISIIMILMILAFTLSFLEVVKTVNLQVMAQKIFWISFIASSVFFYIFVSHGSFFATFEHELTHAVFCLLCLKKIHSFNVEKDNGGYVTMSGSNFIIGLAPYFAHTYCYFIILLSFFIQQQWHTYMYALLGVALGFHTSTTIKETKLYQTDIRSRGIFFSFIVIIALNLMSYGMIISFNISGWNGISHFFQNTFQSASSILSNTGNFAMKMFQYTKHIVN